MIALGIFFAFALAVIDGWLEGEWINGRTYQNKPSLTNAEHREMAIWRGIAVLIATGIVCHIYGTGLWDTLGLMGMMGTAFIPAQRLTFNLTRGSAFPAVKWYDMGGGVYDGILLKVFKTDRAAFIAATFLELTLAAGIAVLITRN